jgi:hypothetical protein
VPRLEQRVEDLERELLRLRRLVGLGAQYGPEVSSEVLYRMWQAEREDNTRLRMLLQAREAEHETFKDRVKAGLELLCTRSAAVSARLAAIR